MLDHSHSLNMTRLQQLLDKEDWNVTEVTPQCQEIVNKIMMPNALNEETAPENKDK